MAIKVLVVDDSSTVIATLRRMLEQNGYEVIEALDGEKGVDLATGLGRCHQLDRLPRRRLHMIQKNLQSVSQKYEGEITNTNKHNAGQFSR